MKIAYFDCSSGISGDMVLGSLVDAGVSLAGLSRGLKALKVGGYALASRRVKRAGFRATKVDVKLGKSGKKERGFRRWEDVEQTVRASRLPDDIQKKGLSIFLRLFRAEARVHGRRYRDIHLHETGAVDCMIDIFGTLLGLRLLGIRDVYASPINLGGGAVQTSHGTLPVPAPATSELLKGVPVYASDSRMELTTPTGAALISSLCRDFMPFPRMSVSSIGIGAGGKDTKGHPNILRLFIGEGAGAAEQGGEERISVVETNIDDMNPQVYEYVMEMLFRAGALDVFLSQIIMKKGRPGVTLTVLCGEERVDSITNIILQETTSIGLRYYYVERKTLGRELYSISTEYGDVRVKRSYRGERETLCPEYEDCRKIAKKHRIPIMEVIRMVEKEAENLPGQGAGKKSRKRRRR